MWYKWLIIGLILLFIPSSLGACEEVPPNEIVFNKWVSIDGGTTWEDEVSLDNCQDVMFQISVFNEGTITLSNIVIKDDLPDYLEYVADPPPYTYSDGDPLVYNNTSGTHFPTWKCTSLPPWGFIEIIYYVHISCTGDYANVAYFKAETSGGSALVECDNAVVSYQGCIDPPLDMTAWWPLDESTGATAADMAGTNNAGTYVGDPTQVPAKVCNGLKFDGVDDYVEVNNGPDLNFGTSDFSIDMWIQTLDDTGVKTIIDKRERVISDGIPDDDITTHKRNQIASPIYSHRGYCVYLSDGYLGLQLADGAHTNYTSTAFVANGDWHHIAVTVSRADSDGIKFYLNSIPDGSSGNPTSYINSSITNASWLRMGCRSFEESGLFNGVLDEVELFNCALTQPQIESIFNCGKCR
jgi:uncharacterized repeat protein (TIGR01451 family)